MTWILAFLVAFDVTVLAALTLIVIWVAGVLSAMSDSEHSEDEVPGT